MHQDPAATGARIIKVEAPRCGDDSRAFGPFVNGKSLYFASLNYDKQSIALDLKQAADREIFEGLLEIGDVVVENFRPGTMEKLGYGWETLHARYPKLIYGSASGFGDSGPYSRRAAYDMVVQGMGGVMSMTGHPGGPPTRVGVSIGDMTAGLYLTIGLVAAIYKRSQGGAAVKVDVAMLDCQVAILEEALTAYMATGEVAAPGGSRHPRIAPFQVYSSRDGYLVVAAGNDRLFGVLAQAMGRPDLLENPEYKTNALRRTHVDALERDLEATLRTQSTSHWLELFTGAGVPCAPVNTVAQVAHDPQVIARNMVVPIADPTINNLHVAGNPIKLSGVSDHGQLRPPPDIDADRAEILALIKNRKRGK